MSLLFASLSSLLSLLSEWLFYHPHCHLHPVFGMAFGYLAHHHLLAHLPLFRFALVVVFCGYSSRPPSQLRRPNQMMLLYLRRNILRSSWLRAPT